MLTLKKQKKAAKAFAEKWAGVGDEKQDTQRFWFELLQSVYGIENPSDFIRFEQRVKLENISYIDAMIPATHTMIEQKSIDKPLNAKIRQSDGSYLTPLEQARRYSGNLPYSDRPRWIIGCNFSEFQILDMDNPNSAPEIVYLRNLETDFYRLNFMVNIKDSYVEKELEISKTAGELVGQIYDLLLEQYKSNIDLTENYILQNINKLCVRLVFCLYAEDAGLFGTKALFHDYLSEFKPHHFRKALLELFRILDTPIEKRDPFDEPKLLEFPYVNGNLFSEMIEVPPFNESAIQMILDKACAFDWSAISPTIFGAIFESTLNPETRHQGGMHYTSIENIHKVIDPLFLNEYKENFKIAMSERVLKKRIEKLKKLQDNLSSLTFLDPATGSGNFLTETYLSLRRLENDILRETITDKSGSGILGFYEDELNPIKVTIQQFYGIEINDFAVAVSRTAMWIAEAQMFSETEGIINREMEFLPLHNNTNIHEANSLTLDWKYIVSPENLTYIIGNPPFLGYGDQTDAQKKEMLSIWKDENGKVYSRAGKIDYVSAWYFKAAEFIQNTNIQAAFVSTNSIVQGEQVAPIWKPLFERFKININFAWTPFKWNSESSKKATVHCVILGFSTFKSKQCMLYSNGIAKRVEKLSPYLIETDNILLESRTRPLDMQAKEMTTGNRPAGKALIIEKDDYNEFIKKDPKSIKYIKKLIGAEEFIHNKERYCLWLVGVAPSELIKMPEVMKRIKASREERLKGAADRRKLADKPSLFRETKNPKRYILFPLTTSENRRYIPLGFLDENTIPTNSATIIEDADLYDFGILISNVHMAWMRSFAGRLEMRYRYSKEIVYNNFPWPKNISDEQRKHIEYTAQQIIDVRAKYNTSTLGALYNDLIMPSDLRDAHRNNNIAVMKAYGFSTKITELDCVRHLLELYKEMNS